MINVMDRLLPIDAVRSGIGEHAVEELDCDLPVQAAEKFELVIERDQARPTTLAALVDQELYQRPSFLTDVSPISGPD